jgi:hypothetical protein
MRSLLTDIHTADGVDCRINPAAPFRVFGIGPEAEPLVIVDDLFAHPQSLVDWAARDDLWGPAGAAYPGIRRPTPDDYLHTIFNALSRMLGQTFGFGGEQRFRLDSSFAMITHVPEELRHNQRVPHVDRTGPLDLAMVHYLCDASFGGTNFFRHRSTGWQRITDERQGGYNQALNAEMNRQVLPNGFPTRDHPLFEHLATVEPAFNRLVVYRAGVLHSPAIERHARYSADPLKGRLTVTSFLFAEGSSQSGEIHRG